MEAIMKANGTIDTLVTVLDLAEKMCEHHEAEKAEPETIDHRLLKACQKARAALDAAREKD